MTVFRERRRARPLLGTRVTIRVRGVAPEQDALDRAIDAAFAEIEQVHRLMSFHEPASDVGRLNRRAFAEPVGVDPRTWTVLAAAQAWAAESDGAFDITVAPRLERRGLLPAGEEGIDPGASWRDVELLAPDRVRFRRRLRLDLGGIAKGFAVDRAIEVLRERCHGSALVDAGGDMRACGPRGFRIALRHPGSGAQSRWQTVLRNAALASSATGFAETHEGHMGENLIDPRYIPSATAPDFVHADAGTIGESDNHPDAHAKPPFQGVAVLAPTAMMADALTKIVLFAAPAVAEATLARHRAGAVRLVPAP